MELAHLIGALLDFIVLIKVQPRAALKMKE